MFIGNANGSFDVIGGKYYVDLIDGATSNVTTNSFVKRDGNGNINANTFVGNLSGIANTANALTSPITITFGGDVSGNVIIGQGYGVGEAEPTTNIFLSNVTTGGTFGNSTHIPVITVDTTGRITNVANVQIVTQDIFDKANVAFTTANAAFAVANVLNPTNVQTISNTANSALTLANLSYIHVNSVYDLANTINISSLSAGVYANAAFLAANNAVDPWVRDAANSASSYANSAFASANLAANTAATANSQANIAFNTALATTNLTTILSNTITSLATSVTLAYNTAQNTSTDVGVAGSYANSAYRHSNAAFTSSNTKLSAAGGTIAGSLIVTGNLTVSGNLTYIDSNQLNIGDNIITLNADIGQSATPTQNAGIEIDRGIEPNASITWEETGNRWLYSDGNSSIQIGAASAGDYANSAYLQANAAFAVGAVVTIHAEEAFAKANVANNRAVE
jgi:hypothetical protein